MDWLTIELTLGLVALASLIGVGFRYLQGRGHTVLGNERIDLAKLRGLHDGGLATEFGKKATTVLFSTEYCSICPAVNRQLEAIEAMDPDLKHIRVDITERLDLAAHFSITQTPTVLITDQKGRIKFRVSGAPKSGILRRELTELGVTTK